MTSSPAAPPRILIVEDEVIIAMEIESRLESAGYAVCGLVATGEDAVRTAREQSPDLILMDITLRGAMNGLEAADRIRAERSVPMIFLSASVSDEILRRIREFRTGQYISKPFEESDLLSSVQKALRK
jgi:CheY-like chemotaxis protein